MGEYGGDLLRLCKALHIFVDWLLRQLMGCDDAASVGGCCLQSLPTNGTDVWVGDF